MPHYTIRINEKQRLLLADAISILSPRDAAAVQECDVLGDMLRALPAEQEAAGDPETIHDFSEEEG